MRKRRPVIDSEEAELNMTPMLDIVFILLIFFVVTASFLKESGVDVSRPTASTAVHKEHGNILIGITASNEIWIDKQRVELHAVKAHVVRLRAENPQGAVVIQADQASHSGLLVRVIDQTRMAGISDIAIAATIDRD
jgi:biopolymer transport protein ExbD